MLNTNPETPASPVAQLMEQYRQQCQFILGRALRGSRVLHYYEMQKLREMGKAMRHLQLSETPSIASNAFVFVRPEIDESLLNTLNTHRV